MSSGGRGTGGFSSRPVLNTAKIKEDLRKKNDIISECNKRKSNLDLLIESERGDRKNLQSKRKDISERKIAPLILEIRSLQDIMVFKTEEQHQRKMKHLQHTLDTNNFALVEEKKVVAEIDRMKSSLSHVPQLRQLEQQLEDLKGQKNKLTVTIDNLEARINKNCTDSKQLLNEIKSHKKDAQLLQQELDAIKRGGCGGGSGIGSGNNLRNSHQQKHVPRHNHFNTTSIGQTAHIAEHIKVKINVNELEESEKLLFMNAWNRKLETCNPASHRQIHDVSVWGSCLSYAEVTARPAPAARKFQRSLSDHASDSGLSTLASNVGAGQQTSQPSRSLTPSEWGVDDEDTIGKTFDDCVSEARTPMNLSYSTSFFCKEGIRTLAPTVNSSIGCDDLVDFPASDDVNSIPSSSFCRQESLSSAETDSATTVTPCKE